MKYLEHVKRSVVKTVTYRILIILSTFVIVFILTGRFDTSIDITVFTSLSSSVLYFFHERMWNKIHWGKSK